MTAGKQTGKDRSFLLFEDYFWRRRFARERSILSKQRRSILLARGALAFFAAYALGSLATFAAEKNNVCARRRSGARERAKGA